MTARTVAALAAMVSLGLASCASSDEDVVAPGEFEAAWFGLVPAVALANPEITPSEGAVIPPPLAPEGEEGGRGALTGVRIRTTVEHVIEFSKDMHASGSQMWGRIAGLASEAEAAAWLEDEFNAIGLEDVKLQTYRGTGDFW
jgi:hypothetical protein